MTGDETGQSAENLTLWGYRYSVYTRIARMTLAVQQVQYRMRETDPFADPPDPGLIRLNPFGRVPVLDHRGFILSETTAICRYLATVFPGDVLIPCDPQDAARVDQVIAVLDAYGYWPMVRQVFSHAVFRPLIGADSDSNLIREGLAKSAPVLGLLDKIAEEGRILDGKRVTLADLHLAPMLGYFVMAKEGRIAVGGHLALERWWDKMRGHIAYIGTDPGLATLTSGA